MGSLKKFPGGNWFYAPRVKKISAARKDLEMSSVQMATDAVGADELFQRDEGEGPRDVRTEPQATSTSTEQQRKMSLRMRQERRGREMTEKAGSCDSCQGKRMHGGSGPESKGTKMSGELRAEQLPVTWWSTRVGRAKAWAED